MVRKKITGKNCNVLWSKWEQKITRRWGGERHCLETKELSKNSRWEPLQVKVTFFLLLVTTGPMSYYGKTFSSLHHESPCDDSRPEEVTPEDNQALLLNLHSIKSYTYFSEACRRKYGIPRPCCAALSSQRGLDLWTRATINPVCQRRWQLTAKAHINLKISEVLPYDMPSIILSILQGWSSLSQQSCKIGTVIVIRSV
jgi:hypothetical protein